MEIKEFVEKFKGKRRSYIELWYKVRKSFRTVGVVKGIKLKEEEQLDNFYTKLEICVGRYAAGDISIEEFLEDVKNEIEPSRRFYQETIESKII